MAGRHAGDGTVSVVAGLRPYHLGHRRRLLRDPEPLWSYLESFTVRRYAADFFKPGNDRSIIAFICGALFIVAGVVQMIGAPGWRSLGVILVGCGAATLFFLWPLLLDLACAYVGRGLSRFKRPRGRRRRQG